MKQMLVVLKMPPRGDQSGEAAAQGRGLGLQGSLAGQTHKPLPSLFSPAPACDAGGAAERVAAAAVVVRRGADDRAGRGAHQRPGGPRGLPTLPPRHVLRPSGAGWSVIIT
jgi:hypothetical protein